MYQGKYVSQTKAPPRKPSRQQSKTSTKGTRLFYTIYGISSAVILAVILILLIPLNSWLIGFEASQPHQAADKVFQELFVQKDWKAVYAAAGIQDTKFENADSFAGFMNQKVGDNQLSCLETSAGLSGDRKYVVRLGDEKIATFTLVTDGGEDNAQWTLDKLELNSLQYTQVNIIKQPGHTVYINGVALDESYTVRTVTTLAENYLPSGITGYSAAQQYVGGLFSAPKITAKDAAGNELVVFTDEKTGYYMTFAMDTVPITAEENDLAVKAAEANGKFMIRAIDKNALANIFDPKSEIYRSIVEADSYVQGYRNPVFEDMAVSDICRYTDSLFSVRVSMTLKVTRTADGGIKTFPMDNTYFFTKANGKWLVTNMVNGNVQEQVEKVRLTYVCDGQMLASTLVSSAATKLTPPAVTIPAGQEFVGWAQEVRNADGTTTMRIVFTHDETGTVYLTGDTKLEPMTLIAVFKDAGGEQ